HFFTESAQGAAGHVIPANSLLAKWQSSDSTPERQRLATEIQRLLQAEGASPAKDSPDAAVVQQLTALGGPLLASAAQKIASDPEFAKGGADSPVGLDPALFGKHPNGEAIDSASLCVRAPSVL